ncbi:MAG: hypothetical protein QW286_02640, partial [Candidatus Aenigmatarchaeota archaeon]
YSEKTYEIRAELNIISYSPDGVEIIKRALLKAATENGVEVKYISTPKYMVISRGKNYKEIKAVLEKAVKSIADDITKQKGECTYSILE